MSFTTGAVNTGSGDNAPLDPAGWVSLAAGLLIILITFFTSYSHVDLFGFLQFKVNQQIGIPLLLAAMAALVARLNWHPTIDAQIRVLASEKRTKLIENDIERLSALESKLDSLLLSADSSSQTPPETDCN